jgi:hypothetical protein
MYKEKSTRFNEMNNLSMAVICELRFTSEIILWEGLFLVLGMEPRQQNVPNTELHFQPYLRFLIHMIYD